MKHGCECLTIIAHFLQIATCGGSGAGRARNFSPKEVGHNIPRIVAFATQAFAKMAFFSLLHTFWIYCCCAISWIYCCCESVSSTAISPNVFRCQPSAIERPNKLVGLVSSTAIPTNDFSQLILSDDDIHCVIFFLQYN